MEKILKIHLFVLFSMAKTSSKLQLPAGSSNVTIGQQAARTAVDLQTTMDVTKPAKKKRRTLYSNKENSRMINTTTLFQVSNYSWNKKCPACNSSFSQSCARIFLMKTKVQRSLAWYRVRMGEEVLGSTELVIIMCMVMYSVLQKYLPYLIMYISEEIVKYFPLLSITFESWEKYYIYIYIYIYRPSK